MAYEENVAKYLNNKRRSQEVYYKDATPENLRELIYYYNTMRYGDKLGPTYDYLSKKGKSDISII